MNRSPFKTRVDGTRRSPRASTPGTNRWEGRPPESAGVRAVLLYRFVNILAPVWCVWGSASGRPSPRHATRWRQTRQPDAVFPNIVTRRCERPGVLALERGGGIVPEKTRRADVF